MSEATAKRQQCRLVVRRLPGGGQLDGKPWSWSIFRTGHFAITPPFGRTFATRGRALKSAASAIQFLGLTEQLQADVDQIRRKIAVENKRPVHDYRPAPRNR